MNKISFTDYEYNRLSFLLSCKNPNNTTHNNRNFYTKLLNKVKNFSSNTNPLYFTFLNNSDPNDILYLNNEFASIYKSFTEKFREIYGVRGNKKMMEDLYFLYLPLSRGVYRMSVNKNYLKNSSGMETVNPIILGMNAPQSCGKTTMCSMLTYLLGNLYHINTDFLSIDDLYSTYNELEILKSKDNRFKFRAPPGTHDLELAKLTLGDVKAGKYNFELPRYDKAAHDGLGDRSSKGKMVETPIDVLLFEGWFQGARPVSREVLIKRGDPRSIGLNVIQTPELVDFQDHISELLKDYVELWDYIDYWIIVKPMKYKLSHTWRIQAEKKGMSYEKISNFVNYTISSTPPQVYQEDLWNNQSNTILRMVLDKDRYIYL